MKRKVVSIILALFLGNFGIHKFYLRKNVQGILYLLFSWTFIPSILAFIDVINLILMSNDKFNHKYNKIITNDS